MLNFFLHVDVKYRKPAYLRKLYSMILTKFVASLVKDNQASSFNTSGSRQGVC